MTYNLCLVLSDKCNARSGNASLRVLNSNIVGKRVEHAAQASGLLKIFRREHEPLTASYRLPESMRSFPLLRSRAQTTPVRPKVPPLLITSAEGSFMEIYARSSFFGSMTRILGPRRSLSRSGAGASAANQRHRRYRQRWYFWRPGPGVVLGVDTARTG
jgi:hypothetical protein